MPEELQHWLHHVIWDKTIKSNVNKSQTIKMKDKKWNGRQMKFIIIAVVSFENY